RRLAVERDGWFVSQSLGARIAAALDGVALSDGSSVVEGLRAVKSPAELAAIRRAAGYARAGLSAAIAHCAAGTSENDLAAAMLSAAV
ncbi:aminopeptidase P family protein, partial [Xanthomonas citri pv. citri]|nr:aminopeptidase P family protein [Xanthomonas citri pv. citri]